MHEKQGLFILLPAFYGSLPAPFPFSRPVPKIHNPVLPTNRMHPALKDTLGLGTLFWLIGYLAGMILFFSPFAAITGWIIFILFTPFTILVTWWWFRPRARLSLQYYAGVGVAWTLIAVVLDYLFIVLLFGSAAYYSLHIFLYYALMFLIPVGVGMYLSRAGPG
jgi:hypothetical protein